MQVRKLVTALFAAVVAAAIAPSTAVAGNLIVTGHDTDHHCADITTGNPGQCHFVQVGINYARAGAPDPSKPVLVLTNRNGEAAAALDKAFGPGAVPRVVIDPRSAEFMAAAIDTATYSAIFVGSDHTCGGCDLNDFDSTADSDAINTRAADITAFFNAGGGLFVNSGAQHGDGDPSTGPDNYYNFLPIPVGSQAVAPPFTLTDEGRDLGLEDARNGVGTNEDINCCETHNAFQRPPEGSALKVAEFDSAGSAETLYTRGSISNGQFVAPAPEQVPPSAVGLPASRGCVDTRKFSFRLRNPAGRRAVRVDVFINGRRKKTYRGADLKRISIAKLPQKRFVVRILVLQDNGAERATSRTYRGCKKSRVRRG